MGEIAFIHLSDIHFRKSSGNRADIDADLRNAILMDIKYNAKAYLSNVKGILVGGDVAFAGQREEYDIAKWSDLDNVRYFYNFFKKHEDEFKEDYL